MMSSRRQFLYGLSAAVPLASVGSAIEAADTPLHAGFPAQVPEIVRDFVGASHAQVAKVKEMLAKQPALAKATWDWGFGDWETALGAASHVGNREIADLLLANGAHPTIFSAAMLGQLDVVKMFVAASPGIQRTLGPHSITLMSHAKAGGPRAEAVVEYLKSVGGADDRPATQPLTDADIAKLSGVYAFGAAAGDRVDIAATRGVLQFTRPGQFGRGLAHLGKYEFYPVGAEHVRIKFVESSGAIVLTVHDPDVVLTARKS